MLMKFRPGVNIINILRAAFICADPNCIKMTVKFSVFSVLLGSVRAKAACRMLMKFRPGVNFINILPSSFLYESFLLSYSLVNFGFIFFWQKDFSKKNLRKMLMKLTPGRVMFSKKYATTSPE